MSSSLVSVAEGSTGASGDQDNGEDKSGFAQSDKTTKLRGDENVESLDIVKINKGRVAATTTTAMHRVTRLVTSKDVVEENLGAKNWNPATPLTRSPRKPEPLGSLNTKDIKCLRSSAPSRPEKVTITFNITSKSEEESLQNEDSSTTTLTSKESDEVHDSAAQTEKSSVLANVRPPSPQPSTSYQAAAELASTSPAASTITEYSSNNSRPSSPNPEGEYEVEKILDYEKGTNGAQYFIKWKGWSEEHNTWEPPENLETCGDAMWEFYVERKAERDQLLSESSFVESESINGRKRRKINIHVPPDPRPFDVRINEFFTGFKPVTGDEVKVTLAVLMNQKKVNRWDKKKIEKNMELAAENGLSDQTKDQLRDQLLYYHVESLQEKLKKDLKRWEKTMNLITTGMPQIVVENNFDLAGPPTDFIYENDYVTSDGIEIPDDPPIGCTCEGCFSNKKVCCPAQSGVRFCYTIKKKLCVTAGTPIYECNRTCKCGPECANRVVQDGLIPLKGMIMCIYMTDNGRGWGVKTLKSIKKGTFVCLYVGEIINTEEAERRGKEYDINGCTYLFDLDFNEDDKHECPYTVDAARHGNISHFMNHSCDPNLTVFGVWVNCLDPNLPKLALFANRDIAKNEELTFDYKSHQSVNAVNGPAEKGTQNNNDVESAELPLIKLTRCKCGSPICRKILF